MSPIMANERKNVVSARQIAVMKKRCFDQVSPACAILMLSGTDFALELRSSSSLSVPSTCSRRVFCWLRDVRSGTVPGPVTRSLRFSILVSPESEG